MDQTFNELDLTSLLSLSFSTLITELHDKLSELGFEDISKHMVLCSNASFLMGQLV